jgi:predicted transcriptional regulator of viral defense system
MQTRFERRQRLFELAGAHAGYFTSADARKIGYDRRTLWHHVKAGHFERVQRGFYRLVELPSQPHEDVIAAWWSLKPGHALVSHETALTLYDLASTRDRKIHLTVPRAHRPHKGQRRLTGVQLHTSKRPFGPKDIVQRFGVRLTSPVRTIVDAATAGTDPSVVIESVDRAREQGLLDPRELREATKDRPKRVRTLIERALEESEGHAAA